MYYCKNCGSPLDRLSGFCPHCGYKLDEDSITKKEPESPEDEKSGIAYTSEKPPKNSKYKIINIILTVTVVLLAIGTILVLFIPDVPRDVQIIVGVCFAAVAVAKIVFELLHAAAEKKKKSE